MIKSYKKFLVCRWYDKDIWGYVIAKHKTVNLGWIKVWPNIENVPHLAKKKWLLQDFSKWLSSSGLWILNFSFETIWWMKKKRSKKMKNWMWFFFLAKILWLIYGNLWKKKFLNFCWLSIMKKTQALFSFLKIFEFWIPMFIYKSGLAASLVEATSWVTWGYIHINNKPILNPWYSLKLYDYVSFESIIWKKIITNFVWILYFGTKATKWRRCISSKLWSSKRIKRSHFISLPNFTYFDAWAASFYWWKPAVPNIIKFYFSINLSHILKYVTI